MEKIERKISLEPFYSRQKSSIPFIGMYDRKCPVCGEIHDDEITGSTWTCEYCGAENESEVAEYNPNLNWGKIAYGVDFDELYEISGATSVGLYGEGILSLGKLNFQEMMDMYTAAKKGELQFGEDLTEEDIQEISRYRSIVQFMDSKKMIDPQEQPIDPCCDPCAVPSPPPEYEMDSGDFYIMPNANLDFSLVQSANIIGAYTFAAKDWIPGKRYFTGDKVIYDGKTFQLREFPSTIMLTGSTSNCGGEALMTVGFYKSSEPATAYTEVASQFSADDAYRNISEAVFNEFIATSEEEIVDMGYVYAKIPADENNETFYYYIRPSWGGYKNTNYDGIIYFDELLYDKKPELGFLMKGRYATVHWKIVNNAVAYGSYEISACGGESGDTGTTKSIHIEATDHIEVGFGDVTITGLTSESKLVNFLRSKITVDADNNKLPGVLNNFNSNILDLRYMIGMVKNVDTTGEEVFGDYLADITIETDPVEESGISYCGETIVIQPVEGTADDYDIIADKLLEEYGLEGKYVKFQKLDDYEDVVSGWVEESGDTKEGWITFKYYIGAALELEKNDSGEVEKDAQYIYNGGERRMIYEDRYRFTAKIIESDIEYPEGYNVTGDTKELVYIDIDYNSAASEVVLENIGNYRTDAIISNVTATTETIVDGGEPVSVNFQNSDYFMEDYQLGLSFVANNNDNVYIDRGNATAFERHMRLSEVDTLQDLENLNNGMFKMKE